MLSDDSTVLNPIKGLIPINMSCYLIWLMSLITYFIGKSYIVLPKKSIPNSNIMWESVCI